MAPFNKAIESQRRYEALRKISPKNFQLETVEINKTKIERRTEQTNSKSNKYTHKQQQNAVPTSQAKVSMILFPLQTLCWAE